MFCSFYYISLAFALLHVFLSILSFWIYCKYNCFISFLDYPLFGIRNIAAFCILSFHPATLLHSCTHPNSLFYGFTDIFCV